ncbi:MAG: TVP38/TMEM64 family protein [Thermodesulfobacteriota bacterium]
MLFLLGLFLLWSFSPLASLRDPEVLRTQLDRIQDHKALPLILTITYILGGVFLFPMSVINMAGVLLLGPWQGFQYAYLGNLASAAFNYFLVRFLGPKMLGDISEQRVISWSKKLAKNELLSMILIRNLPLSFGLVSMWAAISKFSLRDYFLGTMLGMLPGLIAVCFLAQGVRQVIYAPDLKLLLLILAVGLILLLAGRTLRRHLQRKAEIELKQIEKKK